MKEIMAISRVYLMAQSISFSLCAIILCCLCYMLCRLWIRILSLHVLNTFFDIRILLLLFDISCKYLTHTFFRVRTVDPNGFLL